MPDLFAAASKAPDPEPSQPSRPSPRWEKIPAGRGYYLHRECHRCGNPIAPYGEGFSSKNKTFGTWWCRPCFVAKQKGVL